MDPSHDDHIAVALAHVGEDKSSAQSVCKGPSRVKTVGAVCNLSSSGEFRGIFAMCVWSFGAFLHYYSDYLPNQNPLYSLCGVEIAGTVCLQNVLLFSNLTILTCAGSSHVSSPTNTWANFTRLSTTLWPGQKIKVLLNALTPATILSHVPQRVSKNFVGLVLVFVCARVFTSQLQVSFT